PADALEQRREAAVARVVRAREVGEELRELEGEARSVHAARILTVQTAYSRPSSTMVPFAPALRAASKTRATRRSVRTQPTLTSQPSSSSSGCTSSPTSPISSSASERAASSLETLTRSGSGIGDPRVAWLLAGSRRGKLRSSYSRSAATETAAPVQDAPRGPPRPPGVTISGALGSVC